eukprot:12921879-Prorocentrum_lima.AAC.1
MGLYYKTPLPCNIEILQDMANLYTVSPFNIFSELICPHSSRALVTAQHISGLVRNAIRITAPSIGFKVPC